MRNLDFDSHFDHIVSVCVYEHIPLYGRVSINRRIPILLKNWGTFSITFDYRNPSRFARINSPRAVREQFVEPSGMSMRGNEGFFDNGKNYLLHPFFHYPPLWRYKIGAVRRGHFSPFEFFKTKEHNDYTFGALFLRMKTATE
jgi:hypothetical protein